MKYYLFLANSPIKRDVFERNISSLSKKEINFAYENERKGFFLADNELATTLSDALFSLHDELGITLTVVASHTRGKFEEKMLNESLSFFPNQCLYLTDMLLKELSFGDYSSLPLLSQEFKGISQELLLTAGTFLRCGLNALLTAEVLYIHRNTFNYRMNAFIEKTGLDIRDYHNALLLELYFQLASKN